MKKSITVFIGYLLISLAIGGCSSIQVENISATETVQAVQAAIDLPTSTPSTVMALADAATPTVTATPSATHTPRPTQTPTRQVAAPTPTETSSPQSTPTVTPTKKPVARIGTGVVLEAEDVPPEFEEIDLVELGLTEEDLVDSPFPVDSIFAFATPDMSEAVVGVTARLSTFFDRLGFDLAMAGPDLVANLILRNMGDRVVVLEQEPLAVPSIGENSSGITALADVEGDLIRVNVAIFRKRTTGAFVAVLYPEEGESPASASDLAQTLADKIE